MGIALPKDILDAVLASMRGWTGAFLPLCTFRKGPQHTVRLTDTEIGAVFVTLVGLPQGEEGAGIGNRWWHHWAVQVELSTPDLSTDPGGTEDARLDLLGDFIGWLYNTRCVAGAGTQTRISDASYAIVAFEGASAQVWRTDQITLQVKSLVT